MNCKKCNTPMHQRASKAPVQSVQVFVCTKCGTILFVSQHDELKWEEK